MNKEITTKEEKAAYDLYRGIEKINAKLTDCVSNFVEIGFELQKIKNNGSYQLIDYKTFDEFVSTEFRLGATSCKNYIAVANRFGDESTGKIRQEYKEYSLSQLVELLPVADDIDQYSPDMSKKEIRSMKLVSRLTGYSKGFIKYLQKFEKEEKEAWIQEYGVEWKSDFYRDWRYEITFLSLGFYAGFTIYFYDGYFVLPGNEYDYDLSLDHFKKIFEKKFREKLKSIASARDEKKRIEEESRKKAIAALPENEPGISPEEKTNRIKEREDQEIIKELFGKLRKKKGYQFDIFWRACYKKIFAVFDLMNNIRLDKYPLLYEKGDYVCLINGMDYFRFYNDYIQKFDYDTETYVTVITWKDLRNFNCVFQEVFGSLYESNLDGFKPVEKKVYLCDMESVVKGFDSKDIRIVFDGGEKR